MIKNPEWRKSLRSGPSGANCVELAALGGSVGVRDSKSPSSGHLALTPARFAGFVKRVKQDF